MSKRQELRQQVRRQQARSRLVVIGLVVIGAMLVVFALVLPGLQFSRSTNATLTAVNADPLVVTPRAFTARVDGLNLGDPNAPVKVVVYADFRCSACKAYVEDYEAGIIQNYVNSGKVYYSYAVYVVVDTIDMSDASRRSANAAMCASAQNKFWDYHDTLYANQVTESPDLFTDARLVKMAQGIGLDMEAFNSCYQAKIYDADIVNGMNAALQLNVNSTPTIFVNGLKVDNWSKVAEIIEQAIAGY